MTIINALSLGEQIEEAIKGEILSGELIPGQRLSIDELAQKWGVSSMPVRDAVRRLETSGFLIVAPRRGVFVSKFDQTRFKNILDIRSALECLAIELSIESIPEVEIDKAIEIYREGEQYLAETGDSSKLAEDDQIVHDLIIKYCNNPKLIEIMDGLQSLIDWGHKTVESYLPDAFVKALPEHFRILEALKERDLEASQSAMRTHLKGTLDRTLAVWSGLTEAHIS
ncbi:MAG: GntR family transcriptional regulator [Anaerolineales bacterium]|jgi:DNA-binding GntR family transcriptional regulator